MAQTASLSGLDDPQTLKLKVVEETRTKRIDTQVYLKETLTLPEELRVLNSLHDLKIAHNAVIMVEQKTDEELAADAGAAEVPGA